MDAPAYFLFGFLTYFFLNRLIDCLCFRAGRECQFDCSKCDLHCAGYVCYKHRNTDSPSRSELLQQDCVTDDCNTEVTQQLPAGERDCNTHHSDKPN